MVVGVCALAAALAAAVGRSLGREADEALQVWIVAGSAVFVATGLLALVGASPELAWSVLLLAAVLAARFVPGIAVDVPDQYLIDLERLAVTAWSARETTGGKRGRSVVPPAAVAARRLTRHPDAHRRHGRRTPHRRRRRAACCSPPPPCRSTGSARAAWSGSPAVRCCSPPAATATSPPAPCCVRRASVCWVALAVVALRLMGDGDRWVLAIVATVLLASWSSSRSRPGEVGARRGGLDVPRWPKDCAALSRSQSVVVSAGWFRQLWEMRKSVATVVVRFSA